MEQTVTDKDISLFELFGLITQNNQQHQITQPASQLPHSSQSNACEEATVQCDTQSEESHEQAKCIQRLTELLTLREEQGVGLHLAVQDKQNELLSLHQTLQAKDEEIVVLTARLNRIQTEAALRQMMMNQMQSQLNCVWNEQIQNGQTSLEKLSDQRIAKGDEHQQIVILPNEQSVIQHRNQSSERELINMLNCMNQDTRRRSLIEDRSEETENSISQFGELRAQNEELKRKLNDFQWKHFCLESELQLVRKQKQQLKMICEKLQGRTAEYEGMINDQMVSIYSLKEKNQWLSEDNIEMIETMRKKERQIFRLRDQQQNIKEYAKEETKQLRYRIKEKEEEFKEVTDCLRLKITQVDECKRRCQLLQKEKLQLQYKLQYAQLQNYELQQSILEHQQIMQKQSQKIEELTRNDEFFGKKMQEECMLKIIRTREWEEKYRALEHIIRQKTMQLQDMSIENMEKDKQNDRHAQELQKLILQTESYVRTIEQNDGALQQLRESLRQSQNQKPELQQKIEQGDRMREELQSEINRLRLNNQIKDHAIEKCQAQLEQMRRDSIDRRQQIKQMSLLLKEKKEEELLLLDEKDALQRTIGSMNSTIQQINVSLAACKYQMDDIIQSRGFLLQQLQKLQRDLQNLSCQRDQLLIERNQLSEQVQKMRAKVKNVNRMMQQQITVFGYEVEQSEFKDETVQFQVLEDNQNYEVIENEQNQILRMRRKIEAFLSQMSTINAKYLD